MPWPLYAVESVTFEAPIKDDEGHDYVSGYKRVSDGALFIWPKMPAGAYYYNTDKELVVKLPGNMVFMPYFTYGVEGNKHTWQVTGEVPKITCKPSIRSVSENYYHGHITDGVITDDQDGHKYDELGCKQLK